MKFKVGDKANGVVTSEEIIEADSYEEAVEMVLEQAGLYVEPYDDEGGDG